ncbi:MAG: chemotaxis protein CheW [Phycisphaerales bacterium]|nr:chemotaxis protein CheW [Planctomycetota bacterium]
MNSLAVIWSCGGLLFSTATESVIEVLSPVSPTPAPGAPAWLLGLFDYRGKLIPLVRVSELLGRERAADRMSNRVLVVKADLGADFRQCPVGLWVDHIVELERPDFGTAHPGFAVPGADFLGAVVQTKFGQVREVRAGNLFTAEQIELLAGRLRDRGAA